MTQSTYDVAGIGNALVDVIADADERFLIENGIEKGAMTLIDTSRAEQLYAKMGTAIEISGGSGANTIAGLASLGGRAAFMGKVRGDQLGDVFAHDMRTLGVTFSTPRAPDGDPTGRCLILVTPDAQRSMNTYLGAASSFGPDDVDLKLIEDSQITYLEGYLFDPAPAKQAFLKAAAHAHKANRKVALTLSDSFCVERYRDEFRELVSSSIDILFANEAEILSLYEAKTFDQALQAVRGECDMIALTRSEAGSVIVAHGEVHVVDAERVEKVVDTTGAGDLFAAGFLYGITHGKDPATAGRIGSIAAAEVISHYGPRPRTSLKELVRSKGI